MSEKQPKFNPDGVMHGPHKPLELYGDGSEGIEDAIKSEQEAVGERHDTKWSMSYDVIRLAGLSNGEDFKAENTLKDAMYQEAMNKVAVEEAYDNGFIDTDNRRAGRRAIREAKEGHSMDYWNKMHELAGDDIGSGDLRKAA